jgi:hypothetical protein
MVANLRYRHAQLGYWRGGNLSVDRTLGREF